MIAGPAFDGADQLTLRLVADAADTVEVQATSGTGTREKTATQTITVTVTDVDTEAPGKPAAPNVSAASATSLNVSWSAPANDGPAITDYDHRHRTTSPEGNWTEVTGTTSTALSATIGSLAENTSYDVQVRATNDEGTGAWSDSGTESTDANAAPAFDSSATFSAAENQTTAGTVEASDGDTGDNITGYALTGGADQTFFSIGETSGELTFKTAPNFEDAKDLESVDPANAAGNNQYVVVVTATSGAGEREKTATQTITVTVTDVDTEAPGKPAAPNVSAASATSLSVSWSAPSNAGPAITDYDHRHRTTSPEGNWTEVTGTTSTALSATIGSLAENTSYDVQVRATNDEGTGAWSDSGTESTDANAAPAFDSSATFSAAENQTTAGTVEASDGDTGDNITGYALTGGADQTFFSIGETSGELTFDAAPNFEDAKDQNTNNQYVVEVQATSGTGTREKTATQTITVTVTDVDEGQSGTVAIDDTTPVVGDELTASTEDAVDPDGLPDPFTPDWQWYRTPDGGSETEITGAASATYTVVEADLGVTLTAKATWTDKGGFTNTLASAPTSAVAAASALPTLSVDNAEATEGSPVTFTVTLTPAAAAEVTVAVATSEASPQSAISGTDFTAASETLTFAAGETSKTVTVTTTGDELAEGNETFTVTLSSPTNATLSTTAATATGTIVDDDAAAAPTITDVAVTSMPVLETDTYGAGEEILFTVTFSGAVDVTGDPELAFSLDSGEDRAPYKSGTGTDELVFAYTVAPGDEDDDGIFLLDGSDFNNRVGPVTLDSDDAIKAAGSTTDADLAHTGRGTQSGHKVDGTRSIRTVEVISTPQLETDTYGAGETIRFRVTFNVAVDVDGDPVVEFLFDGSEERQAGYVSGSGSTELVFHYLVVSGDDDDNGLFIRDESDYNNPDGPIRLDSDDEIEFKDTSTDVPLYWSGRGTQSGHKVDGSRTTGNTAPSFTSSAAFDAAENQTAAGTVVAADNDADDSVTGYAITGGADMALFEIGATSGELTFKSAPDFEDPQDTGTDNVHEVTVRATSGAGTRAMTADQTIAVTVTNADEGQSGTVTIDDTAPTVGDELTASTANAADPDGLPDPFAPTWKWYRTPDGGSETEIAGETSATYTVVAADLGATLAAKASWTDNGGFANTLSSASTSAVAAASALPTLSIADASGDEDDGVEFTATLTAGVSGKVTATWTASIETGDTAVAADLATTKTGQVEFEADTTEAKFTVPVTDDSTDEDDETFTVTLSNVSSNAQLATDPTAQGTIVDDDTAPTVTNVAVTSTPVLETDTYGAGETIEVSVTFSEAVTATSDTDFVLSVAGAKRAPLVSGSGTATLVFGYTVAPGDEDDNGIWIGDETRTLVSNRRRGAPGRRDHEHGHRHGRRTSTIPGPARSPPTRWTARVRSSRWR